MVLASPVRTLATSSLAPASQLTEGSSTAAIDNGGALEPSKVRRVGLPVALGVLGAALVFAMTLAVIQWRRADRLAHTENARNAAIATAGRFGVALFTYDYNDLPAARGKVVALATDRFAKGYRATTAPAQDEAILRLKAHESARLGGVFVSNVSGDRAGAVVVVRTTVQSTEGARTTVSYLQMALVRQGGQGWKVDTAKAVPAP